jgi:hypothetical protein
MTDQKPIRATWIKAGVLSMAHMHLAVTSERADTDAMRWGRLTHMAILEPVKFAALPVWRGGRRAGKVWDAFEAELAGGEYLNGDECSDLLAISGQARVALATLPQIAQTEVQINWTDPLYGKATARIDALTAVGSMVELKTCAQIEQRKFVSQAWTLGYPLQLGWYDHGLRQAGHTGQRYVLAIESRPPHCTAIYTVPQGILDEGYEQAAEIARRYRICEATGRFAGPYDGQTMKLEPPEWAMSDDVDMGGVEDI